MMQKGSTSKVPDNEVELKQEFTFTYLFLTEVTDERKPGCAPDRCSLS